MKKFEVGKKYVAKCFGKAVDSAKVIARTEHFVTVEYWEKAVKKEIEIKDGCEWISIMWEGVYADDIAA